MLIPVGAVVPYAGPLSEAARGELARLGWLPCEGQLVSVAEYPRLFAAIGFTYGKQDEGHFFLPDYRAYFLRGVNGDARMDPSDPASPPRDPDVDRRRPSRVGGSSGNQVGTVQEDTFQDHEHHYKPSTGTVTAQPGPGTAALPPTVELPTSSIVAGKGGQAPRHGQETRPQNISVHFLLRAR